jgi:hypothetical protein
MRSSPVAISSGTPTAALYALPKNHAVRASRAAVVAGAAAAQCLVMT